MGRLTTHVLDTTAGAPAARMRVELFRGVGSAVQTLASVVTNSEGRTDAPLLEGAALLPGPYRLVFHVGEYFRERGNPDAGRFLETVPVEFLVSDARERFHVPLLVSPWSYSTYRGS
ncbi:MAG: hydroxyisourate hydrolase [Spirochaetia bacterium]|jgi:5-hydroxyisourate hydrolase